MKEYYDFLAKRRSVRRYDNSRSISPETMNLIRQKLEQLKHLDDDIKTEIRIVERKDTTAKFGRFCLLAYSEPKPGYLLNIGYMLEQMDLYLASLNIGACWYGMARPHQAYSDLDYVIMLTFGQAAPEDFRHSPLDFNRKGINDIWSGEFDDDVRNAVRLAPSACNTQSWRFQSTFETITVGRTTAVRAIIPPRKLTFFNSIDLGISLCFLETVLEYKGYEFRRTLTGSTPPEDNLVAVAVYQVKLGR